MKTARPECSTYYLLNRKNEDLYTVRYREGSEDRKGFLEREKGT
jgi:hypothetical protein